MGAQEGSSPVIATEGGVKAEGGRRCRHAVSIALRAFLELLESASKDGAVTMEAARKIGNAVIGAGGPLADFYCRTEEGCDAHFTLQRIERQRTDYLGRLMTQPFGHLLDEKGSGIERKNLGQFFAAMRMILGDEVYEDLKERCSTILNRYRTPDALVDWDGYYTNPEAKLILEQVLVTIARSFRRFDPRKDWFMIVMNSNPSTVSLGSSVFVAKKPEDKPQREFAEIHMCRMFTALFSGVRPETFDDERRRDFAERWGSPPEKIFGSLFVDLQRLGQQAGM